MPEHPLPSAPSPRLRSTPAVLRIAARCGVARRRDLLRALVNARKPLVGAVLLVALSISSCGPESQAQPAVAVAPAARQQIEELIEALKPLSPDLTSDILDRHFHLGQERLARAKSSSREVGLAALQRLREGAPTDKEGVPIQPVEIGLLQAAAHAAPEDTRPLLEALVTQSGQSLYLRTEALLCLADTSPNRALEILEPMVTKARPNQTMPPAEFLVGAWITACGHTGRSPVKELADVATNLYYDETARIKAVKALRNYREPLASQTLMAMLIESTGDGYLRRMAAQGLLQLLSREDACRVLNTVLSREADPDLIRFLQDMIEKNGCK